MRWRNCRFCSQLWVINMRRRVSYSWGALKSSTLFQSQYCSLQLHSDCYYSALALAPASLSPETIGVISDGAIWSVYAEREFDVSSPAQTIKLLLCMMFKGHHHQRHRITRSKCRLASYCCCCYQDRTSSASLSCVVALIPARHNCKHKMRVILIDSKRIIMILYFQYIRSP